MLGINKIYNRDCLEGMRQMDDESVDLIVTDPPYGISFMGRDWDKAVPPASVWKECLRVLKPGAFAFVMSGPRQDCLSRMIVNLEDAGFEMGFTGIYWCYAQGFPKALSISKAIDKRMGAERERLGTKYELLGHGKKAKGQLYHSDSDRKWIDNPDADCHYVSKPATPQAKVLDGSYTYSPKPAVEVVLVCQKPMTAKTYVGQALRWYEEREKILKDLTTELVKCYSIPKETIEWEE